MDSKTITREQLCKLFDHTNLKVFADRESFVKLCREAAEHHFAMVAINSGPVALCKSLLKGTDVHVGSAVSYPTGQTTLEVKKFEAEDAIKNGADEIDYIINIGELKNGNLDYIRREMEAIVAICRRHEVISKVIFENCFLTREEIVILAKMAREVKPDFIKTSTGTGPYGARVEDVILMKEAVGDGVKVKAAGGIRTWEACKLFIDAGVSRIGTSSGLDILKEFDEERTGRQSA
jgi:deoxyribose-phosphate aldolase